MTTVAHLRSARDLYASAPSHAHPMDDPVPGTYCVVYALTFAEEFTDYRNSMRALERAMGTSAVVTWNYEHSTEAVLAAFDEAIANEEAREQEFTATPISAIPDTVTV